MGCQLPCPGNWIFLTQGSNPCLLCLLHWQSGPLLLVPPDPGNNCCHCCSATWLCLTLWNPMHCSMPGFFVHHQLPEFTQTHVHRVSDATQSSHPLWTPSPPAFSLSSIRAFSNKSVLHIRWPKCWNFSFSISPSNEYSGLISFRMDCLDLLAVQGTLKSLLQQTQFKSVFSAQHSL